MKLLVRVIEARNLPPLDANGLCDPYVKLQLGKQKFKSKVIKKCLYPSWCEEFTFKVEDLKEELIVTVLDEDKYFNDDFVGQIKLPVGQVFEARDSSLGTSWYTLQPKNKKAKNKDCGEILLTICFTQTNALLDLPSAGDPVSFPQRHGDTASEVSSRASPTRSEEAATSKEEKLNAHTLASRIAKIFNKNADSPSSSSAEAPDEQDSQEGVDSVVPHHNSQEQEASSVDFEELVKNMEMRDQGGDAPSSLSGGVVLDQLYAITPQELNSMLFSSDSNFAKSLSDMQGSTDLQIGPWRSENNGESLKRMISYTKAASKLVKALKAMEEQIYLKADGKNFAVLSSVSTPDAPYGKTFKSEVLYCITPGPEQPSGELSSRLEVSWRINFLQSTMMKGMIEGGARQGIKESFEHYEKLLSQKVKPLDLKDAGSERDHLLASLHGEQQSDWRLAVQYLANCTVVSTILMALYVLIHIWLSTPSKIQGLEFNGLDLPDSIGELIVSGVLALQGKRALEIVSRFMQARGQKGTDHGIKARGDGWLLTVALIEGSSLAAVDPSGFSDPYVVFTCNGQTRASSIKFQNSDPRWNEIFEFDAMDEPPSVLDVEVFDFEGPFDEATSLGRAEINFLKSNISNLSDVWIPLQGKLAQACQSKLHLRIFLNNNKGCNVVKDYITKMEKEVGKKIKMRSPQTNSTFQKLFGLPPEEFLINDFACHLKRKMPLQGRMFLSARILGFHADLFGHKTKFFFLWEDVEDIRVIPPTLSSMGSPIIIITLWPGRGLDARHGAKRQDEQGRLKYNFQSFVSFNKAYKTIMALWKARALTPEQKVQMIEEESEATGDPVSEEDLVAKTSNRHEYESEAKSSEEGASFLELEDVNMSVVYASILSVPTSFFMELFRGSEIDRRVMERAGCLDYSHSPWEESEKPEVYQRQLYYKFDKSISRYAGEVTSTQQKSRLPGRNGWLVEEVMTLHGIPLGEYFTLHLRYQAEDLPARSVGCSIQVLFGISWLKNSRQRKRIGKNIVKNLQARLKVMCGVLEKEYVSGA
ncbi:C2 and GRAM domain-containing protein At1g03370-like isoform X2 [Andrographis paniculata]|uniref:C2 and GRAM domain-containing protein At1g03370-like isoform X2 n=1 Tax=Andrographis paniculata TaxID=175694 RepID=UPI0021E8584E|nr:C2 and GRAM domain-containing protein At1g03370-like isoform X2 [Andrographis paniculata]